MSLFYFPPSLAVEIHDLTSSLCIFRTNMPTQIALISTCICSCAKQCLVHVIKHNDSFKEDRRRLCTMLCCAHVVMFVPFVCPIHLTVYSPINNRTSNMSFSA